MGRTHHPLTLAATATMVGFTLFVVGHAAAWPTWVCGVAAGVAAVGLLWLTA